jgi:hypothetical protein
MVSDIPMSLLQTDDWIAAVCNSGDVESVREIMVRCAETMLPYWEARFDKDESMSHLTTAMRQFLSNPSPETQRTLKSLIPSNRFPRTWDLSPPPGVFPENVGSDCPADFAGDAIAYAALALVDSCFSAHSPNVGSALDVSIEAIARLFGERDTDDDSKVDHYSNAKKYIRRKLLGEPVR